jgi:MYXO-CTERM domain-containing protein
MGSSRIARTVAAATLGACASLSGHDARAHIQLLEPTSWVEEGANGDPQKAAPCGGSTGTPTSAITEYHVGDTITVRWRETVPHPGHFRISLAENRTDFVDPPVQADANQISISADIMDPPVLPVLKDNISPRTSVAAPGTMFEEQVTLPDTPCEKCTLQVIQFMAEHAPGYFYHHCADIRILAAGEEGEGDGAGGTASSGSSAGSGGTASSGSSAGSGGTASSGSSAGSGGSSGAAGSEGDPVGSDQDDDSGCSVAHGAPAHVGSFASLVVLGLGAELWRRRRAQR